MGGLRGEAAIVGIAEFAPVRKPDRTWMGMEAYAELARQALEDAGMTLGDVDALMTGHVAEAGPMFMPGHLTEYLGIQSHLSEIVDLGGAASAGAVLRAAIAIETGMCETALCIFHTLPRPQNPMGGSQRWGRNWGSPMTEFDYPYGAIGQNFAYATIANRYAYEYGLTDEQRAKVAVDQRTNAVANPKAVFRTPIDIDDVLNSPMIVDPLHMLEIVMPCFGGGAIVVTSKEKARKARNRPAYIIGGGENTTHLSVTYDPDMTHTPIRAAADRAWAMAGVKPRDIDLASLYDCYTITVLLTLEDAGFCGKGEAGKFVEEHDLTYRGDFPMNTHGGQLSFGQAGIAGGISHITEAYLQVTGRAGDRQLKRCDTVFVHGNGGLMSEQVSLILRGE
ncbi:MAG TPA: thiolase family protein [Tepidiformaceae bacterium]|jgi:acetyl-CoA acetyltransferase|nr:thiolase family protein [Tepidiformaceae bacterium]